ncbi:MAG: MarR family transcriptional regulator [Nitrospirae bacterium]|nr:MarR family transcriptional regulator [Nitrospirota bacterium]
MKATHYTLGNYKMDESVGFLISLAFLRFERALASELKKKCPEATPAQWKILMLIGSGRCKFAAELAYMVDCDMGSITRTLDRLESKHLVKRDRSKVDRRLVNLSLTDEGMKIFPHLPEVSINVMNELLNNFSRTDVTRLKLYLRRIVSNG